MKNIWFCADGIIYTVSANKFETGFEITNAKSRICEYEIDFLNFDKITENESFTCRELFKAEADYKNDFIKINCRENEEMTAMPIYENGRSCGVIIIEKERSSSKIKKFIEIRKRQFSKAAA